MRSKDLELLLVGWQPMLHLIVYYPSGQFTGALILHISRSAGGQLDSIK
jgi:hypothetical protein